MDELNPLEIDRVYLEIMINDDLWSVIQIVNSQKEHKENYDINGKKGFENHEIITASFIDEIVWEND